jgi:hypothetical protein
VKVGAAIEGVVRSESRLADGLERVGERHRADHDVFHMTATLAKLSRARVEQLQGATDRHDASVDAGSQGSERDGPLTAAREKLSELIGSEPETDLQLLRDLREAHLLAAAVSIDWTILGQGAQAARDTELLAIVNECHAEALRTLKWTTTHLKIAAPQALTS